MAADQEFRLTWVNYSQKLTESFHKFLLSESLCNVTLSVNRKSIKAHQSILSACSPWFEQLLIENKHPHPIIILKDVRYLDLKNIIRFIYTGEVLVHQNDLHEFLQTAELLEIKGLLKSTSLEDEESCFSTLVIASSSSLSPPSHLSSSSPSTLTSTSNVPSLNSLLLGHSLSDSPNSSIHELVSAIKVPMSLQESSNNGTIERLKRRKNASPERKKGKRHRKCEDSSFKSSSLGYHTPETNQMMLESHSQQFVVSEIQNSNSVDSSNGNEIVNPCSPLLSHVDDDDESVVSWLQCGKAHHALTAAELVATGINDCGPFKRIWSERYLCYNLGREIICLLCFCRFTQFKKFNLERHMRNKHAQLYGLSESARKHILERYVARYEEHVTPGMVASVPTHGSETMATEIMSMGPIHLEDLDLNFDVTQSIYTSVPYVSSIKASDSSNERNGRILSNSSSSIIHEALLVECELEEQEREHLLVKEEKAFSLLETP